ncbi:hypothetical protein MRX96_009239 [Rhipicephalus microplus]
MVVIPSATVQIGAPKRARSKSRLASVELCGGPLEQYVAHQCKVITAPRIADDCPKLGCANASHRTVENVGRRRSRGRPVGAHREEQGRDPPGPTVSYVSS